MKKKTIKSDKKLVCNPLLNKGTSFTERERDAFALNGVLPYGITSIEDELTRRYKCFLDQPTPLAKYVYLSGLQNTNETLFYKLIKRHVAEMLPIVYTPTVGEACTNFSTIFAQTRGLYFSYPLMDKFDEIVKNIPADEVDVVVVTDGERILGLGDLGAGGMGISIGKLALYTVFGGINPSKSIPIVLDVGTNKPELLSDPTYIGWRHERIRGDEYLKCVDKFVAALTKRFPNILIQWEDFAKDNAKMVLNRFRKTQLSFNDDIQGTAAVTLAALYAAVKEAGVPITEQKIVLLGAGSAGVGICEQIEFAMIKEGLDPKLARDNFYILNSKGLIHESSEKIDEHQKHYARKTSEIKTWKVENPQHISLLEVVKNVKPTMLIGVSTMAGAFTEEIVKTMAASCKRPIIFPLSNPTSKAEALPEDLIKWTDAKAIISTGSPFKPVEYKGKTYAVAQCNNVYIFPGVGLGVISCHSKQVNEDMFIAAAKKLSEYAPILNDPSKGLFPPFTDLPSISKVIAFEVAAMAMEQGHAKPIPLDELKKRIEENYWEPDYLEYEAK